MSGWIDHAQAACVPDKCATTTVGVETTVRCRVSTTGQSCESWPPTSVRPPGWGPAKLEGNTQHSCMTCMLSSALSRPTLALAALGAACSSGPKTISRSCYPLKGRLVLVATPPHWLIALRQQVTCRQGAVTFLVPLSLDNVCINFCKRVAHARPLARTYSAAIAKQGARRDLGLPLMLSATCLAARAHPPDEPLRATGDILWRRGHIAIWVPLSCNIRAAMDQKWLCTHRVLSETRPDSTMCSADMLAEAQQLQTLQGVRCFRPWSVLFSLAHSGHLLDLPGRVRALISVNHEWGSACCLHNHHTALLDESVTFSGASPSFLA